MATMEETVRPLYDTLAAVRRLTKAGMPEPHAEAVVREQIHVMEHNLATKADIETLRFETKADIETLRLETKADIEKLRLETKTEFESVRGEITKAKLDLIKWVFGANIALVAVVIAAVKLL